MSTTHRIEVTSWGEIPTYTTTPTPPAPSESEFRIHVLAAGVARVVISRASGKHYSASQLPHLVGADGVGRRESDNKLVYFTALGPQGSMQEVLNVANTNVFELPDGADAQNVAAMMNPLLSSWMGLKTRVDDLPDGFKVLIVGVTSASGKLAVQVAKHLGAGRVIGVARSEEGIKAVKGVDEAIVLKEDPRETEWDKMGDVDVILDYVYGAAAGVMLSKVPKGKKVQYVQIGSVGGEETTLPSAVLRSKNLTLRGSGPGAWSLREIQAQLPEMVKVAAKLERQPLKVEKFADVEKVWGRVGGKDRVVFVP